MIRPTEKILYQNENEIKTTMIFKKNENEIKTKMIDGKADKNDNENESLNENSTAQN